MAEHHRIECECVDCCGIDTRETLLIEVGKLRSVNGRLRAAMNQMQLENERLQRTVHHAKVIVDALGERLQSS